MGMRTFHVCGLVVAALTGGAFGQAPSQSQLWDVRFVTDCRDAPAIGLTLQARVAIIANPAGTANFGVMRVGGGDGSLLITVTDPNGLVEGAGTQGLLLRGTTGEVTTQGGARVDTTGQPLAGLFSAFRGPLAPVGSGGSNTDAFNGVIRTGPAGEQTLTAISGSRAGIYDGQPLGRATIGPGGERVGEYASIYRFLYVPQAHPGRDWNPEISVTVRNLGARYIYAVNGTTPVAAPVTPLPDRTFTFQVPAAPVVLREPEGGERCPGRSITLAPTIAGLGPLSYQWFKNGEAVAGATAATLTLANLTPAEGGNYSLGVSSACGSAMTEEAVVTVTSAGAPSFTQQPTGANVCAGRPVRLSAAVSGEVLGLQWLKGAAEVAGATASELNLAGVGGDAGVYRLRARWACGDVLSDPATIEVNTHRPSFTSNPQPLSREIGQEATLTAQAADDATESLTYQWLRNGVQVVSDGRVSGSASTTLRIRDLRLSDAGRYELHVLNSCVSAGSMPATLTVAGPRTSVPPRRGERNGIGGAVDRDGAGCIADFNRDGELSPDDLSDFITCSFATLACPAGDVNGDGRVDPDDFSDFVTAYFGGC